MKLRERTTLRARRMLLLREEETCYVHLAKVRLWAHKIASISNLLAMGVFPRVYGLRLRAYARVIIARSRDTRLWMTGWFIHLFARNERRDFFSFVRIREYGSTYRPDTIIRDLERVITQTWEIRARGATNFWFASAEEPTNRSS